MSNAYFTDTVAQAEGETDAAVAELRPFGPEREMAALAQKAKTLYASARTRPNDATVMASLYATDRTRVEESRLKEVEAAYVESEGKAAAEMAVADAILDEIDALARANAVAKPEGLSQAATLDAKADIRLALDQARNHEDVARKAGDLARAAAQAGNRTVPWVLVSPEMESYYLARGVDLTLIRAVVVDQAGNPRITRWLKGGPLRTVQMGTAHVVADDSANGRRDDWRRTLGTASPVR